MEKKVRFSKESIKELIVHLAWAQLEIISDEVDDIQVLAAGDEHTVEELRIMEKGASLLVEQPQYGISMNITTGKWMQVIIRVPEKWAGLVDAHTISGLLNARGLSGQEMTLETVSGDLRAMSIAGDSLSLKTISGDVKCGGLQGKKLSLRTVSGDINLQSIQFETVKSNSVSGQQDLEFENVFARVDGTTVSGNMTVHVPAEHLDAALRSVTGRIRTAGISISESGPMVRLNSVSADLMVVSTLGKE